MQGARELQPSACPSCSLDALRAKLTPHFSFLTLFTFSGMGSLGIVWPGLYRLRTDCCSVALHGLAPTVTTGVSDV